MPEGRALRMLVDQTRYQLRIARRSPRALVSTAAMPLVLLVLLETISDPRQGDVTGDLTASMIGLALLQVCYQNLASGLVASRDTGLLKRLRATPLPLVVHISARVLASTVVACALAAVVAGTAAVAYGATLHRDGLAPAVAGLVLGSVTVSLIGLAVAQLIPRSDAAPAVLSLTLLPVVLISGMFFPTGELPGWVGVVSDALPVSHLLALLGAGFSGEGWQLTDLAWVAAWGAIALVFAVTQFRTEPGGRSDRRRRAPGRRGHGGSDDATATA